MESHLKKEMTFMTLNNNIEPSVNDFQYFQTNEKFATDYVDNFIEKSLQNEFIPDLLIETVNELNSQENKNDFDDNLLTDSNSPPDELKSDQFVKDVNSYVYSAPSLSLNYNGKGLISNSYLNDVYSLNRLRYDPYYSYYDQIRLDDMLKNTDTEVMRKYINQNALDILLMEQSINQLKIENRHLIGDDEFENSNRRRIVQDNKRESNNYSRINKPVINNSKFTHSTNNNNTSIKTPTKPNQNSYTIKNSNVQPQNNDKISEPLIAPKIINKTGPSTLKKKEDRNYLDIRNKQIELQRRKPSLINNDDIVISKYSHSVLNLYVEDLIREFLKDDIMPSIIKDQVNKMKTRQDQSSNLNSNLNRMNNNVRKSLNYDLNSERARGLVDRVDKNLNKHSSNEVFSDEKDRIFSDNKRKHTGREGVAAQPFFAH